MSQPMPATPQAIALTPPGRGVFLFLAVVLTLYFAFLVYLYARSVEGATPELQQEHFRGMTLTAVISLLTGAPILWAISRRSLVLTDSELQLRAGFYKTTVRIGQIRVDQAEEVSLFQRTEYAPRWRTNGIKLPGYRVGWFRLRNGDKAMLYLTNPFKVTRLPTTAGYVMLLSTSALLPALRARAGAAAGAEVDGGAGANGGVSEAPAAPAATR
jgi:hypothetical protein